MRLLRYLVTKLIDEQAAEIIAGDLDEAYANDIRAGRRGARWRYGRACVASIWAYRRRGPGRRSEPSCRPGAGGFVGDVRFAARQLRNGPGFTAIAILTLAIGIGANTTIFSVVNGVLLRPLPYRDPGELINVWQVMYEWQDSDVEVFRARAASFPASYPVFQAWIERGRVFESIAAYNDFDVLVQGDELAAWVPAVSASAALFEVLGVEPALGRGFSAADEQNGVERVVVLSHGFWREHYAGDPGVIGDEILLTGTPHVVIGVMPPGFYFPARAHQLWTPLSDEYRNDRWTSQSLSTIARLRDGVSLEAAQRDMDAVTLGILEDNPESPDVGIRLVGRVDQIAGSTAQTLLLLMAAVGLVLAVTTANMAALLLVKATSRRQEIAVRRALGASRARLTRQLLTESALLTFIGGGGALAATASGMQWLRGFLPATIPRVEDIAVDWRVAGFTFAVAVAIALVFALAAALHSGRYRLVETLRAGSPGAGGGSRRGRSMLVVGEVAVAVVLLVGATLLLTSYVRLNAVDRGFDDVNLLTLSVGAPLSAWNDEERLLAFHQRTLAAVEDIAGVQSAATISRLPFSGNQSSDSFALGPDPATDGEGWSLEETVTPGYFETMRIPLLRGRLFMASDAVAERHVTIVNERLAREHWADGSAIDQTIWENGVPSTIVGVVGNVKHLSLAEEVERKRYRILHHDLRATTSIVVRTRVDPASLATTVRNAVRGVSPQATVSDIASMTTLVAATTSLPRLRSTLFAALALAAVSLTMLGVYGVVAFTVVERRRDIGVRLTLGAAPGDIFQQVLRGGFRLVVPGVVLGVATAAAAVRLIESYVYDITTTDPSIFALAAAAVGAVAGLAIWLPARRATRVEPLQVLRGD